ncbi:MAG: hypothetical protein HY782_27745, partial [Chloroflexi bacterium]|nr:hypothetical protein [Chloroflexota bacterium]
MMVPVPLAMAATPMLRVYLLGALRIERDTQTIRLPTRKVESLLAFLVLHPEPHPREKLAALLWNDSSDELARRSLRTGLTTLRKALGEDLLLADRDTVQLNSSFPLWVDALEIFDFRMPNRDSSAIPIENPYGTLDSLKSKIENYHGDLLSDFYDDWILPKRERLRSLYLDTLLRLAQNARSRSEYAQAIEWAQKVLASDPANEKAYQHLIFCSAALGDRIGALNQYDECAKRLCDELGVEPSKETVALRDRIAQESTGSKSREALLTNLPHPLTSFIGREREIAEVKGLLDPSGLANPKGLGTRLLTLTGSGGCGKTRLAIEVASQLVESFPQGVWWVDLAPLSDAALVPQAAAQALGVREAPNQSLEETLVNYLRGKRLLLVLDNCEHLIEACARLAAKLLSACAELTILTTSREAAGISGEIAWRVPSFAVPDIEHLPPLEQLINYDAIQLFVQRAAAVMPNWKLNGDAPFVARVCARLDGMPLAIELAVARLKVLSVEQIAARLDDRFNLLTTGSRAALPRQQTLRATVEWSYDLLSDTERTLLRRLSVFAGGWTIEAAESVCVDERVKAIDVLDLLARLLDKSLVLVEMHGGAARYRMLEMIRQYARGKLIAADELQMLQARHLDFFVKLAQDAEPKLKGPDAKEWMDRLEGEYDNIRAVFEYAMANDVAAATRLASALVMFWVRRTYLIEGRRVLAQL